MNFKFVMLNDLLSLKGRKNELFISRNDVFSITMDRRSLSHNCEIQERTVSLDFNTSYVIQYIIRYVL
jgi:hypothetical protein